MSYQAPITVKQVLQRVHQHDYVLPAIQREFVWTPAQVCRLFDSLLRGYPIGTFLFWSVTEDTAGTFNFYEVMREFHEAKNRHCERIDDFSPRPVTAILDGQQRLSALNIGLRGSYAAKVPRKKLDPYPVKYLYLDLCFEPQEEDEVEYRFDFLTADEAEVVEPSGDALGTDVPTEYWYRVSDVLALDDFTEIFGSYIQPRGLGNHPRAYKVLASLHQAVHQRAVVSFFMEEEQSLGKVLDIFVRVNSGGTVLSKSDLLLSVATAQFTGRDARDAVHALVDDLNSTAYGFSFSKDMVLKSGMILTGLPDPGFKVENFTRGNMQKLDASWDSIEVSLKLAAKLAATFGFSSRTLSGNSVLIPVAHYLHDRKRAERYLSIANDADHQAIKGWMVRSLIKPGVWGSGLDTLLKQLMRVIRTTDGGFPVAELEAEMAKAGKDLTFGETLLQDLVETPYRNKRVYALLTLLYPGVDVRNEFHEDHIFPRARFTKAQLVKAGVDESEVAEYRDRADRLPNLQLLEGSVNIQKQKALPLAWVEGRYPDEGARKMWLSSHDLHDLPAAIDDFAEFYDARRERMLARLRGLFGAAPTDAPIAAPPPAIPDPLIADRAETATSVRAPSSSAVPHGNGSDQRSRRAFARRMVDLIELGRIQPGEIFHGSYHGRSFSVEVQPDGSLESGGYSYSTPSGAATELTGQTAVNGWVFWHTANGEPIGDLR